MSAKKSNTINTLVVIIVVILCVIFMANTWVSSEIEQTQAISVSASPISSKKVSHNRNVTGVMSDMDEYSYDENGDTSLSSTSGKSRKKRQKIIYEIPLDDVNLVQ